MSSLTNVGGLWVGGKASRCLVPDPEKIRAREIVAWGVSSIKGVFSLPTKVVLPSKLFPDFISPGRGRLSPGL